MAKAARKLKAKVPEPAPEKATMSVGSVLLSASAQAAIGTEAWGKYAGDADLGDLTDRISKRVQQVWDGDLQNAEAMLYGQAVTLQTMFTALARRAARADQLPQFNAAMSMALKAQAQCRATIEALAEIKNPRPVSFVKQANISNGPQQVNNGTLASQGGQQQAAMSHAPQQASPIPGGELVGHPDPATYQAAPEPATCAPGGCR